MASHSPFDAPEPEGRTSLSPSPPSIDDDSVLQPPQPRFTTGTPATSPAYSGGMYGTQTPRDSVATSGPPSANNSAIALNPSASAGDGEKTAGLTGGFAAEKEAFLPSASSENVYAVPSDHAANAARSRKRKLLWGGLAALLLLAIAVAVPVGVVVSHNNSKSDLSSNNPNAPNSGNGDGAPNSNGNGNTKPTTGGDGSTVTTEDGSTFTYSNKLGGYWVSDPARPFANEARPNSWTPPLNESWTWGTDKVFGVNLGGWFVLEPFISPALYEKYQTSTPQAIDEWTLSQAMAADTSSTGGLSQLEDHYSTFITEEDFAQIAGAGLNWVRVPIPFWAVDVWDAEPFLARVCWKYILRMFRWARKYGLRVNLDLHTIPGSQNGYNHSGKQGQIDFLMGVMGYANAQRALGYIRIIAEFISQPEYVDLVPMFGIINEARVGDIGKDVISHFYLQAYESIRAITGTGAGKGAYISIHDGFQPTEQWAGYFPGADRLILDTHPYFAFSGQPNTDPVQAWAQAACQRFAPGMAASQTAFGVTVAGEFSNGYNDCGYYLNGVSNGHSFPGDCGFFEDSSQWNATFKAGLEQFALASMDSLQNWFFWTWKIGNNTATGKVGSPLWSYQAGLEGGWMPTDPRTASGVCAKLGVTDQDNFSGNYAASATGAGPGTLDPAVIQSFSAWPPPTISGVDGDMGLIPTYTATGAVSTLPPDTTLVTAAPKTASVTEGNGWADAQDTAKGVTEVAGCTYPNAWDSDGVVLPTAVCTGAPARVREARSVVTPPPAV